ncbi:hypothetical protein AKJ57_02315 [candidate division MSBL1 archaeon SCGC-AAA259A05]|uniref:Orn/DAP/Arg decarboxylase 2 N-terminal domain-containing protein n=1 Tax=candidate division MSBL1 archaeon SCGC-AAA259A05 TaxID=1698259 RepID=A0A133UAD9_9EURY|nr:hypothetical protein AKJ57_02315 [candidate division MSBL1 archaeon SCGC-AAA259A05]
MMDKECISQLADEHGTPFYLVECESLMRQYEELKESLPEDSAIAYATKANYTPSVVRTFRDLGMHFDVFSPGELNLLMRNGCDPGRVIYTSVAEQEEEFMFGLKNGVSRFVLGSINGIKNFGEAVEREGVGEVEVLLRIQPVTNVDAAVSTSGVESKFGTVFSGEKDSVGNALKTIDERDLDFAGFHFHLGSQIKSPDPYVRAINETFDFAWSHDIDVRVLDIGGGFPVSYGFDVPPIEKFGAEIGKAIEKWREKLGGFELIVEPGRFLTADSTVLVVKVVNEKEMYGKRVLIVNGSEDMVSVDRHDMRIEIGAITDSTKPVEAAIAGNLCHSLDWIVKEPIELPGVGLEDLLVFEKTGAYVMNHNIPYNLRKVPKVLTVSEGEVEEEEHPFSTVGKIKAVYG